MPPSHNIGRRIKLHDLQILMTVVRAGSMSKAAAVLNTTQSAISRSIAELEHAVGARLLDRGSQGVEATQYGSALLKRGTVVFDELKQGLQEIEFLNNPEVGEVRIGAAPAQSEAIVLAVIDQLSRRYPRMVFHVVAIGTPSVYDELRRRRIELGFVRMSDVFSEEDLHQEFLFEERLAVVTAVENPWTRRRKLKLADLVNEPWTWAPALDPLIVQSFHASGLEAPRATVYADAVNMRTRLAMTGRFLAVVPASMLKFPARHASLKMLPVELPKAQLRIGIVTLKNRTLGPVARIFIEHIRRFARDGKRSGGSQNRET
jgi:DNA-binding transcriptional LysR family regulator